jgi:hypothetical protein
LELRRTITKQEGKKEVAAKIATTTIKSCQSAFGPNNPRQVYILPHVFFHPFSMQKISLNIF